MCGRYGFSIDASEVRNIIKTIERRQGLSAAEKLSVGEVFPTECAPVLVADSTRVASSAGLRVETGFWGFPNPYKKGVIINARAETVQEKRMFRNLLYGQRCIVPSTGFFEWTHDAQRQRYLFQTPMKEMTYMAGLFDFFDEKLCFIVLTTSANPSIKSVHNRMPIVLNEGQGVSWLHDPSVACQLLRAEPLPLCSKLA